MRFPTRWRARTRLQPDAPRRWDAERRPEGRVRSRCRSPQRQDVGRQSQEGRLIASRVSFSPTDHGCTGGPEAEGPDAITPDGRGTKVPCPVAPRLDQVAGPLLLWAWLQRWSGEDDDHPHDS